MALAAGVGWLYVLDRGHALDVGPRLSGALPLEELAGRSAQPLGRMALAWIPAGVAMTLALGWLARVSQARLVPAVALLSAAILFPMTVAFEALTHNERFSAHVMPALGQGGMWAAVILAVIGSIPTALLAGPDRPARGTVASEAEANGPPVAA